MSDLASLFDAAEQAAVGGDFAAAARLLADAARIQEATLGPDHLDLANTLNNLAVAHERSGQLDAAEREYRRAHAIAARTLPADDPLVATSAQNLREFCAANGRPLEAPALRLAAAEDVGAAATVVLARPPAAGVPTEPLAMTFAAEPPAAATKLAPKPPPAAAPRPMTPAPTSTPAPRPAARPLAPRPAAPIAAARSRLSIPVLVALGAAAALVIWLLAGRGPAAPPARPEAAAPDPPPSAAVPAAAPASDVAPSAPATAPPAPPATAPAGAPSPAATTSPAASPTAADGLTVDEARLCATLSPGYRCQAAGATVDAGRLTFYTRLAARSNTSVVHRWYRGSELRQAVRLDVPARRQGFRTFSRATVSPSQGEWRVELRSRDGQLLHVERFTVR